MPAKRLSMRKIKDVLRLCWGQGLSKRKAAGSCGVSRPTVDDYLRRAEAAGLSWPLPAALDDGALERLLFPPAPAVPAAARGVHDWSHIHRELKRPGVTLQLLWHEYRQTHPQGYQYTWFCQQYRTWRGKLDLVMRQVHRAGEKLFVDYAGMRAQVINPTYQDLATHYGVAIVPARVRRPRDKAKAEVGVQVVERWILAALRHRQCFSLAELNRAIRALLETLNNRPFKKLPGTRRALFEQLDKPALRPLPVDAYEYAEWKQARVHIDYHVEVHGHYYSVPHALIKKQVDVRITANTIECFHRGQRIASHRRSCHKAHHTTVPAHMPESHRQAGAWSPQRLGRWAAQVGPATETLIRRVLSARKHPQQAYRSCLGILRLGKTYGNDRLEAACQRALTLGSHSYKSIESILRHGLDRQPLAEQTEAELPEDHDNIRGPSYYH